MKPNGNDVLPRDRDQLIRMCMDQGCLVSKTGSGHIQIRFPSGKIVVHSSTPRGGRRAEENFRAELKRAGLRSYVPQERKVIMTIEDPERVPTMADIAPPELVAKAAEKKDKKRAPPGAVKEVVMRAMKKIDVPTGRHARDILPTVMVAFPNMTEDLLSTMLANYAKTGRLERVSPGKYRLPTGNPPEQPPAAPRKKAVKEEPAAPLDMDTAADMQVLEEALASLAKLEEVIKKHQQIARQLAPLKALIAAVKAE